MDLFEAIAKRHSYRGPYEVFPIPRDDLRRIVEAGLRAPSGKNAQTTRFAVIDDPGLIEQIHTLHPSNKAMQQAKAYIACIVDRNPEATYEGFAFQVEDCAAAVENMLLAITALGYATVWVDGWLRIQGHTEAIGELLRLPEDKIIRVLLPLGRPAEVHSQKEKMPFESRAWFNEFQG
jgi:nitroreductase